MSDQGQSSRARRSAQALTLLLTYAIKLVGLASACNQLLLIDHPTSLALAVSAFMMAGAQLSEGLILSLIDRLIGGEERRKVEGGKAAG